MKKLILIISGIILIAGCSSNKDLVRIEDHEGTTDSTQYELIVDEPGYDSWMVTNSKPDWYHEKEFYQNWNILYTIEFNYRVLHSNAGHPFTEIINYDSQTNYGLEVEYKLYWYFKYIENKYNTKLHISSR
jgi:uncharacterized protein YcfL